MLSWACPADRCFILAEAKTTRRPWWHAVCTVWLLGPPPNGLIRFSREMPFLRLMLSDQELSTIRLCPREWRSCSRRTQEFLPPCHPEMRQLVRNFKGRGRAVRQHPSTLSLAVTALRRG